MAMAKESRGAALLLSPEIPYPLHGGGALRTASVLHYLAQGRDVDLIVFRHRPEQDPASLLPPQFVRRLCVIDLPFHRKDLASRVLRNGVRFLRGVPPLVDRFRGFGKEIQEFLQGHNYEVAVIEHFWCAEYASLLQRVSQNVALNLHNVESVLHQTYAKSEPGWQPFVHGRFAREARKLEEAWFPRFTEVLAASEIDAVRVRQISPNASTRVFANSLPWTPLPHRAEEAVIAFSGNLEYQPNQQAVQFFAAKVWPEIRKEHPELRWRLIGMNPHAVQPWIKGVPGVECTGSVADAVAELASARLVVVPLFSGSGTRLKIVEAWAAGRPVISTALGAEGLPAESGVNILFAETGEQFLKAIDHLLRDSTFSRTLGDNGRQTFQRELCWEKAWQTLDSSCLAVKNS